jgi:hypothetical protein
MILEMKTKREHYRSFYIAGFTYYDGPFLFENLKVGTQLNLKRDKKNLYDPQAIKILHENVKIGYVPRAVNSTLYKLLKVGFKGLDCVVQQINPLNPMEKQIIVAVYFRRETGEKTIMHSINE